MEKRLSEDEFDSRCDAVLADYPEVAHRANCAAQNAEQALELVNQVRQHKTRRA